MHPYYTFRTIVVEHDHFDREIYDISHGKWQHIEGHTWNTVFEELLGSPGQPCAAEDVIATILANVGKEGSRIYALNHCACPDNIVYIQADNVHDGYKLSSALGCSDQKVRIA